MLARFTLTADENEFYRTMLYRVKNNQEYGQPALSKAFDALVPVSVLGSGTMSIDQHWRVYIDFAEMMSKGLDYATAILNHEIWHILRKHHERTDELPSVPQGYNKNVIANIAQDLEINDDLEDLLPNDGLMPERGSFRDYEKYKVMDYYFKKILENLPEIEKMFPDTKLPDPFQQPQPGQQGEGQEGQQGQPGQGQGQGEGEGEGEGQGQGQGSGSGQGGQAGGSGSQGSGQPGNGGQQGQPGSGSGNGQNQQGQPGQGQGQGDGQEGAGNDKSQNQKGQGKGNQSGQDSADGEGEGQGNGEGQPSDNNFFTQTPRCGGAAGNAQDYEFTDAEGDGSEGSEGVSETDQDRILDAVAQDIEEFMNKGIGRGHGSQRFGSMADWAEKRKKSKYIPWKQELRGNFKQSYSMQRGKMTYDRSRPSRRQPVPEVMFPAMRAPRPTIGIGFDVSGSNLGNLKLMVDELVNIMKSSGVRGTDTQAFAVDTKASKSKVVNNPLTVLDNLVGGGGTQMTPGYEKLAELGNDISILITDGYVNDYPEKMPLGKGMKRSKYITCVILEGDVKGDPREHPLIVEAKKYLGKWGKVIPIVVSQEERKKAGMAG